MTIRKLLTALTALCFSLSLGATALAAPLEGPKPATTKGASEAPPADKAATRGERLRRLRTTRKATPAPAGTPVPGSETKTTPTPTPSKVKAPGPIDKKPGATPGEDVERRTDLEKKVQR